MVTVFLLVIPMGAVLLLPLCGILLSGRSAVPYLVFPPQPVVTSHEPVSWPVFLLILLFVWLSVFPFVRRGIVYKRRKGDPGKSGRFPGWGYGFLAGTAGFWIASWTRFEWFSLFQPHTFFPLWFCWIGCVNALAFKRSGHCLMTDSPARFAGLFAVSAVFWWIFEYLNRFTGNWFYTGSEYPAAIYFFLATVSFSTVLPAVESMGAFLLTFDRFRYGFRKMTAVRCLKSRAAAVGLIVLSVIPLALIGLYPEPLFFTVWISPFFLLLGLRILSGAPHILTGAAAGDFTMVAVYAAAAVICGFFWEMFNYWSLARWQYAIPYVQVWHLFEMPVLGYAGYLPFGLVCALVIDLVTAPFFHSMYHPTSLTEL